MVVTILLFSDTFASPLPALLLFIRPPLINSVPLFQQFFFCIYDVQGPVLGRSWRHDSEQARYNRCIHRVLLL